MAIIQGFHAVYARLSSDKSSIEKVYFDKNRHDQRMLRLVSALKDEGVTTVAAERKQIAELATGRHQGVVAVVGANTERPSMSIDTLISGLNPHSILLAVDGIADPHNLGACLRCADAAGVDGVLIPRDNNVPLTPTVSRVSAGADQSLNIISIGNLVDSIKKLQRAGVWVVGTSDDAQLDLYDPQFKPGGPLLVIMGGEEKGMRRLTREHCDYLINLPMRGTVSSLNVSVATGIVLYQLRNLQAT